MATTEILVTADPKHYVWWFPGSPVKVHLDLQVVQQMKEHLRDAGAGAAAGLLFGRLSGGAVEILDFQPAPTCDVPNIIAMLPDEPSKGSLMGYYRTEENETFHLNAKDLSLAEECFRKPYQVFLMIHSNGLDSLNATFFFRDGSRKMADLAFLEFPFDSSLLAIEERDRIERSHQVIEHSLAVSPAPNPSTIDIPRKKSGFLLKAVWMAGTIALVFTMGTLVNNHSFREQLANLRHVDAKPAAINVPSPSAPEASSLPSLALHAKRQNGDLELTWNRESALTATATSGVISIQDGKSERRIPLDATQVRGGSLLYSPTSDEILMQLTLTTSTGNITESVMVILPKLGAPKTYPLPASTTPPQLPLDTVPLARASKPFTAPSIVKGAPTPEPAALTDSPPLRISHDPAATATPEFVAQAQAPVPPPPLPAAPSQQPTSQQPASITVNYKPAVAIRKTVPTFPAELQTFTVKRTVIEVKVTIDKRGQVSKAEAAAQNNLNQYLVNSAINAARLWIFQPAKLGNDPVPSEAVLQFVFSH